MRIIGGVLKRRRIFFPKTLHTRPVTDRAKETIFDVLGTACESATVVDFFAGSGSLGLEALSRGAREVFFVDSARHAIAAIERNLELLALRGKAHILRMPVLSALSKLEKQGKTFGLIFLDPPHNKGLIKKTLHRLDHSVIVSAFGTIVVGHSNREGLPTDLETLCHQRSIKIGQTFVSFLTREGS
ncbi:MAG: 16S rRNA (guanine(966)-N(2))-methyltransferase RsmD [Candidatus Omnitrophica bacterium]|nr:16S rRNA (guanine(966)-N(2))-methyltransferase RsmD [Candidatus Omnitrophota bacterium]